MTRALALVILCAAGAACRSTGAVAVSTPAHAPPAIILQPGAPGQANKVISREQATDLSKVQATAADIQFMQGMIGHHAQALEMTALIPDCTAKRARCCCSGSASACRRPTRSR